MDDRYKILRELVLVFEIRYEKVLVQFKEVDGVIVSVNLEIYVEIDLGFRNYGDKIFRCYLC